MVLRCNTASQSNGGERRNSVAGKDIDASVDNFSTTDPCCHRLNGRRYNNSISHAKASTEKSTGSKKPVAQVPHEHSIARTVSVLNDIQDPRGSFILSFQKRPSHEQKQKLIRFLIRGSNMRQKAYAPGILPLYQGWTHIISKVYMPPKDT